jgi:hypothetical protein
MRCWRVRKCSNLLCSKRALRQAPAGLADLAISRHVRGAFVSARPETAHFPKSHLRGTIEQLGSREEPMRRKVIISFLTTTAIAVFLAAAAPELNAQQSPAAVTVGDTDIGGVVSGPSGPEAGV